MARHVDKLRIIFQSGVNSVQPSTLFTQNKLINKINDDIIAINNHQIDLTGKKCHLIGFGKAVLGMAVQMERILDKNLYSGIISIPKGMLSKYENNENMQLKKNSVIKTYEGAENNLPDKSALTAAREIFSLANSMSNNDILFVLISGGGSALLPLPLEPLTLESKLKIIKNLSRAGATIEELNTVRIAMSKIKGGKLALAAKNSYKIISLIISDIIGNPTHLIASGPTVKYQNKENNLCSEEVLKKFNIWNNLSDEYKSMFLNSTNFMANVNANSLDCQANNHIYVIGSNDVAVEACRQEGAKLSYSPIVLSTSIKGNIENVCEMYENFLKNLLLYRKELISWDEFQLKFPFHTKTLETLRKTIDNNNSSPILLILAGEPSVNVNGNGLGGRNQELALRMSLKLFKNCELFNNIYLLCAGTDGIDGPTTAAGAIGCSAIIRDYLTDNNKTIEFIEETYIKNNDSFNFYKNLTNNKYHIITGHTGTNVMDIHLIIIE